RAKDERGRDRHRDYSLYPVHSCCRLPRGEETADARLATFIDNNSALVVVRCQRHLKSHTLLHRLNVRTIVILGRLSLPPLEVPPLSLEVNHVLGEVTNGIVNPILSPPPLENFSRNRNLGNTVPPVSISVGS